MVDLGEIQTVYYLVAATGVMVAAFYYIQNMRNAEKNKRIELSTRITEKIGSKEFNQTFVELAYIQWKDIDDFLKRYDSGANTAESQENFGKRWWVWSTYDNLGYLLKENLVDESLIFNSQGAYAVNCWGHWLPIIDYYRRKQMGPRWLENFEYLARRMWGIGKERGSVSVGFRDGLMFDGFKDVFEQRTTVTQ